MKGTFVFDIALLIVMAKTPQTYEALLSIIVSFAGIGLVLSRDAGETICAPLIQKFCELKLYSRPEELFDDAVVSSPGAVNRHPLKLTQEVTDPYCTPT